jgi:hypothetical protein
LTKSKAAIIYCVHSVPQELEGHPIPQSGLKFVTAEQSRSGSRAGCRAVSNSCALINDFGFGGMGCHGVPFIFAGSPASAARPRRPAADYEGITPTMTARRLSTMKLEDALTIGGLLIFPTQTTLKGFQTDRNRYGSGDGARRDRNDRRRFGGCILGKPDTDDCERRERCGLL